jgi:signal transduction histidine kinase
MIGTTYATLDFIEHPVMVLELAEDGRPIYVACNANALQALDMEKKDIVGLTADAIFHGHSGRIAFEHQCEAFETVHTQIYDLLTSFQGADRLIRSALRPETDDAGTVIRVFVTMTDVSEAQSQQDTSLSTDADTREFEQFISLAAHDLRGPMAQVQQIAELLKEDFQDMGDGKYELLDLLEEIGVAALRLVDDVLSHTTASSAKRQFKDFPVEDLIQDIMLALDPLKKCKFQYPRKLIHTDKTALQIILQNMVDNAIKYSQRIEEDAQESSAKAPLELIIEVTDLQDGFLKGSVKDNGVGFGDPALVFLDNGKLRKESGFGLFGIKRLIHARGGAITVSNRKDTNGAEISFSLPGSVVSDNV